MKAMLRLIHLDEGEIFLDEKNIQELNPKQLAHIAFSLSDLGFFEDFNLKDTRLFLKNMYDDFDG
jgi:ABC-type cobalamin/Fe3+-siderophores transport system ATPase subunit